MYIDVDRRYSNFRKFLLYLTAFIFFCMLPETTDAAANGDVKTFSYTGSTQTFTVPATGLYRLEVWGARGGNGHGNSAGGYGAYASGETVLTKGTTLYVYVGQMGNDGDSRRASWNGGAIGGYDTYGGAEQGGSGGGATDIRLTSGAWNTAASLYTRLIVAGGGGGAGGWHGTGGYAGGLARTLNGTLGTGTTGVNNQSGGGGGGGGYYGGATNGSVYSQYWVGLGGNGGSSFVKGCSGCPTTYNSYLGSYTFSNISMIAGNASMPSRTGTSTMTGNNTNGYARITLVKMHNTNAKLSSITVSGGTFNQDFDPDTFEYDIVVDSESAIVDIDAIPQSSTTTVSGIGQIELHSGLHQYQIVSTAESGDVLIYTLNITRPASPYKYLKDIKIGGESIEGFVPENLNYNITVGYDVTELDLEVVKARLDQQVFLPTDMTLKSGNNEKEIVVISEDGSSVTTYTLNIYREHSSKLKTLIVGDYELDPKFDPDTNEYTVNVMSSVMTLKLTLEAFDEEATYTTSGFGYIKGSTTGKITVTEPNSEPTIYTINIVKEGHVEETIYDYKYTGSYQTFVAPALGFYKLEAWGARGGHGRGSSAGGNGAYTAATIKLEKGETLYIYVGQIGNDGNSRRVSWNGGAIGGYDTYGGTENGGSGGGASDIRLAAGAWNDTTSLYSRLIVAGGGGGAGGWHSVPGYAGGLDRATTGILGTGATGINNQSGGGGGGGGLYGGALNGSAYISYYVGLGANGGTSFAKGCPTCTTSFDAYLGDYTLKDISMIPGNESMPSNTTDGYMVGNNGSGHVRITLLPQPSENNFLSSISVSAKDYVTEIVEEKTLTPDFVMTEEDYYVTVGEDETKAILSARPEDSTATIEGLGEVPVLAGENVYEIVVTAEAGNVKTYRVHITRPASDNPYPFDITISGLVPSLCSANEAFCQLEPATFDINTNTYYLTVPSRIKQLWFNVDKGHEYQTVSGEGRVTLEGGENIITIEVTSEDGSASSVYKYYVTRDMTGNTDLSKLEVVDPEREINYDPDITEYYISIPNEYTNIRELIVETDDPNASYMIDGNEDFQTGMNRVSIIVTAQNGETKIYILNVYREKNSNVFLSNIEVSHGSTIYPLSPEYNKLFTGTYNVTVPNEISSVTISATPEVSTTTPVGVGLKSLNTGNNSFTIIATAEDGTTELYTLNIFREKNSNAYLSNITVKDDTKEYALDPIYNKETQEYTVIVDEGVTDIDISATPEVSTTTYKLLDNTSIKIGTNVKRVMSIAEDGTSITYTINVIRPANTNNYLESLTVEHGDTVFELDPPFDKETLSYRLVVESDVTNVKITGVKEHYLATVKGNGTYYLSTGENQLSIAVIAEDGSVRTYDITIEKKPNSNAYLSSLAPSVGTLNPTFDKETFSYTMEVDHTVDKLVLTATPEVSTTKVTGAGTIENLVTGSNMVTIKTQAEDRTELTYTVEIIKKKSNNANLSYLLMEEGTISPTFDKDTTKYTVSVPNEVTKGTFHIKTEDEKSTYVIENNENFVEGENTVTITVTSEDGTTKVYEIIVTRQEPYVTSASLLNLSVNRGTLTPAFDKNIQYYEVEVPYSYSNITVSATLEDTTATVTGTGTHELSVGQNPITVRVETTDGKTRDYQIVVTRKQNDDARLSSIVVDGSILVPNFDKDTYEYSFSTTESTVPFSSIITMDENATIEIIGHENLEPGENTVTIRVTAADRVTTRDYVLNVTRTKNNNNNLESLRVLGYEIVPEFNKSTTLYTLTVDNDVNTITIEATAEDPNATIEGTGMQYLSIGQNYFVVEVTSESGNVKSYTIVVTKEGSGNNNIRELIVNNGTIDPTFESGITEYDVVVPYKETSLDLTVTLEDENATYTVSNTELKVGTNTVTVIVTAENGDIKTYTLNVTREEIVSALLENLIAKDYALKPTFNSYVTTYDITVDNEITQLDLTVIPLDKKATYIVSGNENFEVGLNIVTIEVTSSDGSAKETYTLNVNRQPYANTFLDYLYTSEGDVTPVFDKETLSYTIDVPNDLTEIEIFAEAVDKSATVTGVGVHTLETGENTILITVTTTSGVTRTYRVVVNRAKSADDYLLDLIASVGSTVYPLTPTFDKDTSEYAVTVPEGTPSIYLSGTLSNENAKVDGLGSHTLSSGANVIDIVVTSEGGSVRTYQVTVNREPSSNNYLTSLIPSIGTLTPEFSYEETEYTINLDSSASLLSFTYSTESPYSKVTGVEAQVVPDGTSTRTIEVTAEDGSIRTYTITVNKERTDNAKLASLYVKDYDFEETFDPDVYEYHIYVPNDKKILLASEVIAVASDANATITKSGNLTLSSESENIYTVKVTAPDGFTTQEYKIYIAREKSNEVSINNLIVNTGYLTKPFNPNVYEYTWMVKGGTILTDKDVTVTSSANPIVHKTERLVVSITEENIYLVEITSEDGTNTITYKLNVVADLSSDATLKELQIDKGYYLPEFDRETYVYDVYEYEDETDITITAIPNADTSIITSGDGLVTLTDTEMVHTIIVTAEDGTVGTYTLNIHKTIKRDLGLKDLTLNDTDEDYCGLDKCILTPVFDTDKLEYSIKVPYEYTNLSINAVPMNDQQTVKYKIGDTYIETYELPLGKTEVTIEVYDGMNVLTREYTLTVERCKSNNNFLKSLSVTGYTIEPTFDKTIMEYTVYVENEIEEVEILAEAEDSAASVYINGYTYLQVGNNDATIEVAAPDGSVRTYIIHIVRGPLYNSYLKNITVSTGVFWELTPTFKSTVYDYTTTVSGVHDKITLEAVPVSPTTTVNGTGEFEIKTGSNIFQLTATAEDGSVTYYTVNVIKEESRNVDLISLIVEEGNLNPNFEKSITKYEVNVDETVEQLTIHAVPEDPKATVMITGNEHLVSGPNTVNVIVMSADKSASKTYQLIVYKSASINSSLSNIVVYDDDKNYPISPEFNRDLMEYIVHLDSSVEMVYLDATAESPYAKIEGIGQEYLDYGSNKKYIIVTAENGNETQYIVDLYRHYNLNLKAIISDIGDLVPEFDPDTTEYRITLPSDEDEITFVAQRESNLVDVEGSGTYNLDYGENEIIFTVTAPDGKTKEYKVIVDRVASGNNYIESLVVHEGILSPVFDRETQDYEVSVKNTITKVGMDIILEDENATYEVIGNENLQLGSNKIVIRVAAQNGDLRYYNINVILQDDNYFSNRLLDITITNGKLNPDFDPDINYYAATVANSITSTEIKVVKENVDATVTGVGVKTLNPGRNVFQVEVTSLDGIKNTYTLVIYREENSDATLSSLVVKNHDYLPIFDKQETNYALSFTGDETSLEIIATPSDPNSTVEITGNKNLSVGVNIISIKVTAPDGITTKEYFLTVTKGISSNNYLASLEVKGHTFDKTFTKTNQGPYVVTVGRNVNSVVVDGTPEVSTTAVTGLGSYTINSSQTVINVEATAEDGSVRVYTIIVNRSDDDDNSLKDIIVSDGSLDPVFDPDTLEYNVKVDENLEFITVTGILSSQTSSITGNGTYTLESAKTEVILTVTAEDGSKREYKVNIVKDVTSSSKLIELIIKEGQLSPDFHKNTLNYTIKVPYEITSLKDMVITPENENATYEVIGNENFIVGNNQIIIRVTSDDGTSTTDYNITVIRQISASNYLTGLSVVGHTMNPAFDKNTLYYEVEVPSTTTEVEIKAILEDSSSTVTGVGIKTLESDKSRFYVTVTSASGSVRTYSIVINRTLVDENLLLTLVPSVGTLNPTFDPLTNEYTLEVPQETTELTLEGTVSTNATVTGLGTESVVSGEQTRTIIVTSQTGLTNIYTVKVTRLSNDNTELISLTPSAGTLEYSNDILEYTMEVEDNVSVISFEAIPVDEGATIEGDDVTSLEYGENEIIITVTASDGIAKREIKITVTRHKDIAEIIPSEKEVMLGIGEEIEITYTLNPEDTSYTEVEWITEDENIADVDETGKITGVSLGSTTVQIRSTKNPNVFANIIVNVISKEITSSVYEISRVEEEPAYVIGIEPKTKLSDFIPNFDNNPSTLFVYNSEGEEVTEVDSTIGTTYVIKLIIKDVVYDELTIVVRGDLNGDSFVTVADHTLTQNMILGLAERSFITDRAADVNKDGNITVADMTLIVNHILGTLDSFNK